MSANLIDPKYRYSDNLYLEKIYYNEGLQAFLCIRSSLLESVFVIEFQATEAYSNLGLTKTVYSIKRLSKVEKENVIVRMNPSNFIVCENKKSTCR
jgi:hypothetical protein